jgi:raffinose synthase
MLIEIKESRNQQQNSPVIYTVLLPLLEGQFRAVLQGNDKNEIEICLESGEFQTWNDVREAMINGNTNWMEKPCYIS